MDAQATFRALMDAMARPGTICPAGRRRSPPAPLPPVAAAVALALCDHDTPLWLDPALSGGGRVRILARLPLRRAADRDTRRCAFRPGGRAGPTARPGAFGQGTQEYPDRSTTLILPSTRWWRGLRCGSRVPASKGLARLAAAPLPPRISPINGPTTARFPLGVDLVLAAAGAVACLPRTTRIVEGEG